MNDKNWFIGKKYDSVQKPQKAKKWLLISSFP